MDRIIKKTFDSQYTFSLVMKISLYKSSLQGKVYNWQIEQAKTLWWKKVYLIDVQESMLDTIRKTDDTLSFMTFENKTHD